MNKAKMIFNQTLMISTGILFGVGVQTALQFLANGNTSFQWQWYIPLSIIFAGFLCSLATLFLTYDDVSGRSEGYLRVCLHFIAVFAIVSLCGYLFGWYTALDEYIPIVIMYVIIYAFVWISSNWMLKSDEKKINKAIDEIRDEE
ncbi:MAG: DUF3021 family protein [Lachnospiraceae bacterium]|nr:DUF3021 family protein [Lachnospiraceae bacterium]